MALRLTGLSILWQKRRYSVSRDWRRNLYGQVVSFRLAPDHQRTSIRGRWSGLQAKKGTPPDIKTHPGTGSSSLFSTKLFCAALLSLISMFAARKELKRRGSGIMP